MAYANTSFVALEKYKKFLIQALYVPPCSADTCAVTAKTDSYPSIIASPLFEVWVKACWFL
jgi:hypothetical protein